MLNLQLVILSLSIALSISNRCPIIRCPYLELKFLLMGTFFAFLIYVYNYIIYKYYYSLCECRTYDVDIVYNYYVNLALSYIYIW